MKPFILFVVILMAFTVYAASQKIRPDPSPISAEITAFIFHVTNTPGVPRTTVPTGESARLHQYMDAYLESVAAASQGTAWCASRIDLTRELRDPVFIQMKFDALNKFDSHAVQRITQELGKRLPCT